MTIEFGTPRKLVGVDLHVLSQDGTVRKDANGRALMRQFNLEQSREAEAFQRENKHCRIVAVPIWTK